MVSGGLFTGPRRVPIREFGYVQGANAKISELTGAEFGDGYERLIADGSFVMDSEAAARGVAALRQAAPDRAVELAAALQRAFYVDGLSLSDPATYRDGRRGGRPGRRRRRRRLRRARGAGRRRQADFRRAAELGVTGFPTLLAVDGDRVTALARRPRHRRRDRPAPGRPDRHPHPLTLPSPSKEPRMSTLDFKVLDLDFPVGSKNKTATLVTGESEALLVDAGFTRADGHRLVAEILDSGKTLTTVFISHGDPDFYFGAEVIADAFPDAVFVATPIVIEHIQHSYEGKLKAWAALGAEPAHPPGRPHRR